MHKVPIRVMQVTMMISTMKLAMTMEIKMAMTVMVMKTEMTAILMTSETFLWSLILVNLILSTHLTCNKAFIDVIFALSNLLFASFKI